MKTEGESKLINLIIYILQKSRKILE